MESYYCCVLPDFCYDEGMNTINKEQIPFDAVSSVSFTDSQTPETFPPHWHNAAEFTLALKDGCRYRIGNVLYELKAGDILLVWPQQVHETVRVPREGAVFIQFAASIMENNLDLVSLSSFLFDCHHLSAKADPGLTKLIADKIYEIRDIHGSADPLAETGCKLSIYQILLALGNHVIAERKDDPIFTQSAGTGQRYIHSACTYITENYAENLTQADVAEKVGLSTFYFSKLFKQYMHISFPAYLSGIRVKKAAALLLDENMTITECAFASGFQSTTAFNKAFHDITGYAPRDYRKLYR